MNNPIDILISAINDLQNQGAEITRITFDQYYNDHWAANISFFKPSADWQLSTNWGRDYEYKEIASVTIGVKRVLLGYWKEGGDFVGALETAVGLGLSLAEGLGFKQGEWWFSWRKLKFYDWKVPGNGFTGGKISHSKAIHSKLVLGSRLLGGYNALAIQQSYVKGEIGQGRAYVEQGVNLISTMARFPYGLGIGLGWELGRTLTSQSWYRQHVRVALQQFFGGVDEESQGYLDTRKFLDLQIPEQ